MVVTAAVIIAMLVFPIAVILLFIAQRLLPKQSMSYLQCQSS